MNLVLSCNVPDSVDIYQSNSQQQGAGLKGAAEPGQEQLEGPTAKLGKHSSYQKEHVGLSQQQKCLNYLANYFRELCQLENRLCSDFILKNSALFFFSQAEMMKFESLKQLNEKRQSLRYALQNKMNIYTI